MRGLPRTVAVTRRWTAGLALGLAVGAMAVATARAQAPAVESPHGDLARDCADCHTPNNWTERPARPAFKHSETGFRLQGAHAQARCASCHESLVFSHVASACADCHRDPHQGRLGFDCERCHTPTSWTNQREMHAAHARTRFPLHGAHARLDCASCHREGSGASFAGTPVDCGACHLGDYLAARDPDHQRAGFSRRCETCHSATAHAWEGVSGSFPHPATFPLTGAHRTVSCQACHTAGFAGTPRQCVACHRDDYDRTRNPNHRSAGFPTACEQCHDTGGWEGATFDHDGRFFPINSGTHRGTWPSCSTCHVNPSNFRVFECIGCHEHRRSEMDDEHEGVRGYSYSSPACYNCHPRGTE
jgi:hypothetical protein